GRTVGPVGHTHTDPEVRQFEIPQMKAVAVVKERTGETEANARLIAAAPDLLAACEAAAEFLATHPSGPALPVPTTINKAVARARGTEPTSEPKDETIDLDPPPA